MCLSLMSRPGSGRPSGPLRPGSAGPPRAEDSQDVLRVAAPSVSCSPALITLAVLSPGCCAVAGTRYSRSSRSSCDDRDPAVARSSTRAGHPGRRCPRCPSARCRASSWLDVDLSPSFDAAPRALGGSLLVACRPRRQVTLTARTVLAFADRPRRCRRSRQMIGLALRDARLEELLDARQAGGDVACRRRRRCGTCASSAACPARRWTGRR